VPEKLGTLKAWISGINIKMFVFTAAVVLLLGMGYYLSEQHHQVEIEAEEESPLVEAGPPEIQDMRRYATIIGSVTPTEQRIIVPELSGRVERVHVEEGDHVEEGELLMQLEDEDYRLKRREAEASLQGARAKLEDARKGARTGKEVEAETSVERARKAREQMERELERVENLHEKGYASEQELEHARLQYENAREQYRAAEAYKDTVEEGAREEQIDALESQVERAETGVDLRQRMLNRTRITAPAQGEIALVDAEEGELVGTTSPALVMLDPDSHQVTGGLPESYVNRVDKGDTVEVSIPSAMESSFDALVTNVGQLPPEEEGDGYPVEIELDPEIEERARAGMYSEIKVVLEERKDVVTIPQHAVVRERGEKGVYTVDRVEEEQQVEFSPVTTGIACNGTIEITSGLCENEIVVTEGFEEIESGINVDAVKVGERE